MKGCGSYNILLYLKNNDFSNNCSIKWSGFEFTKT